MLWFRWQTLPDMRPMPDMRPRGEVVEECCSKFSEMTAGSRTERRTDVEEQHADISFKHEAQLRLMGLFLRQYFGCKDLVRILPVCVSEIFPACVFVHLESACYISFGLLSFNLFPNEP